jgi:hypothetical protein
MPVPLLLVAVLVGMGVCFKSAPLLQGTAGVAGVGGTGMRTNAEEYPAPMSSSKPSGVDGVLTLQPPEINSTLCVCAVLGVRLKKDAEGTRCDVMDDLRPRPSDGRPRRCVEVRRMSGESGPGEPGWTAAAQALIEEVVFERRRVGSWIGVA